MLLAMKDEAGSNLKDEENDFMLYNSYGDETLEELTVAAVNKVNASTRVHEQVNRVQRKTIIHTSDDDQIDSNIIFNDPYFKIVSTDSAKETLEDAEEYKETYEELEREIHADKDTIERILKEKDKIENICGLEEKLSSLNRIVYKMGQSIQTIHMLGKEPNKVYDPFLKARLGYKNLKRLKKVIAAQPKMYDGEMLYNNSLKFDSPDSEETLEDAKES
ncbi:hypothetical protein Tco_0854934 [Tanacetum coccineum]